MQIPRDVQEKVIALLRDGYSAKSICVAINKYYKNTNLKPTDVIILAKKHNIKMGTKDVVKEKLSFKAMFKAMPQLMKNKETRKQLIKSLAIFVVAIAALVLVCFLILK